MNQSLDLNSMKSGLARFMGRFHMLLFFLGTSIALATAIITVMSIVSLSDSETAPASTINSSFDQATIDQLKTVNSTDGEPESIPDNVRINPLVDN